MGSISLNHKSLHIAMSVGDMDPRSGGPPQVVAGLAAALARAGHRVSVYTGITDGDLGAFDEQFAGLAVTLRRFARDWPYRLGRSKAMVSAFTAEIADIDVLHLHGVWEGHLAQLGAIMRQAGKPVLVSSHGMLDRWSLSQSRMRKRLARIMLGTGAMLDRADAVVFGTNEERDEGRAAINHDRLAVVANGVDCANLGTVFAAMSAVNIHARAPALKGWSRTILYFSRIHPKKGLDQLTEAFIKISSEFPGVGLLVVGIPQDRGLLKRLHQMVTDARLSDRVIIITDMAGPAAKCAFAVADIFALPSHQEGFSMAILEAMAAGKALLITDKCHLNMIESDGAGVVVPDTVAGLEYGLRKLLAVDDSALALMGAKARDIALANYDWAVVAAQMEVLYRQSSGPYS